MALSNWDTLSLNEKNESITGTYISPLGVRVDIYKNWLYVRDEKAWEEGGAYVKPTIMQINEGDIRYKDVYIFAKRGPQNGVYCAVWTPSYARKDEKLTFMVGTGVYGYGDKEWVGVTPESVAFLKSMLANEDEGGLDFGLPEEMSKLDFSKILRFNQGDAYFAAHLNIDVPATGPGEAEEPILNQILAEPKGE